MLAVCAVLEFTYCRLTQNASCRVRKIDVPLVSVRVVHAQGIDFETPGLALRFDQTVICSIPDFANNVGSVVLNPGRGTGQRMQEPLLVSLPRSDVPIEIVPAISDYR